MWSQFGGVIVLAGIYQRMCAKDRGRWNDDDDGDDYLESLKSHINLFVRYCNVQGWCIWFVIHVDKFSSFGKVWHQWVKVEIRRKPIKVNTFAWEIIWCFCTFYNLILLYFFIIWCYCAFYNVTLLYFLKSDVNVLFIICCYYSFHNILLLYFS